MPPPQQQPYMYAPGPYMMAPQQTQAYGYGYQMPGAYMPADRSSHFQPNFPIVR